MRPNRRAARDGFIQHVFSIRRRAARDGYHFAEGSNGVAHTGAFPTAIGERGDRRPACGGYRAAFTLLEMMIVLMIIALLAAVTMPAFTSAVNEHRVREDGHQLAMMVRTAMIQSNEQHRPYVIELTKDSMSLHPVGELAQQASDPDAALFKDSGSTNSDHPIEEAITENVDLEQQLDSANKLQVPDPYKTNGWMDMAADGLHWTFQPGELCPATPVRIARGDAYLELNFEALTGNIEGEKSYFP